MDIFYWIINVFIVIAGVIYALRLNYNTWFVWKGIGLILIGVSWHFIRGMYAYKMQQCQEITSESILLLANACVPVEFDIIWSQIAIFTGVFILLIFFFKRQNKT